MSRNLTTSSCPTCGYTVRLSDLRGKPIEFRRYYRYAPQIGCRFDCPCGLVYFAMWYAKYEFWAPEQLQEGSWKDPVSRGPTGQPYPNKEAGRFAIERTDPRTGAKSAHQTGYFVIDLSWYTSYSEEPTDEALVRLSVEAGGTKPDHLCEDNAEDTQWEW